MGTDDEIIPAAAVQSFSIAEMAPGRCWVSSRVIGSTDEECLAMALGALPPERLAHLRGLTQAAVERLMMMPVLTSTGGFARFS